jgi:hypothetical protein
MHQHRLKQRIQTKTAPATDIPGKEIQQIAEVPNPAAAGMASADKSYTPPIPKGCNAARK